MRRILREERGAVLAAVVGVFAVVAILGTAVLSQSLNEVRSSATIEDNTQAYYYARSGVELTCAMVKQEFIALDQKLKLAQTSEKAEDWTVYAQALAALEARLPVIQADASAGAETTVTLANVLPNREPLSVTLRRVEQKDDTSGETHPVLRVSCTANYDGISSTATAVTGRLSVTQQSIGGGSDVADLFSDTAMHAWGDIALKKECTVRPETALATTGQSSASSESVTVTTDKRKEIPIVTPPDTLWTPETSAKKSLSPQESLTAQNNGYYGAFDEKNAKGMHWDVDTSQGDVILVLDSFNLGKEGQISVSGTGDFYLYLVGDVAAGNSMFYVGKELDIESPNGAKTYFIALPPVLQGYAYATPPRKTLTAYDAKGTPTPELEALQAAMPTFTVKKGTQEDDDCDWENTFLYLPGVAFDADRDFELKGSLIAGKIHADKGFELDYIPIPQDGALGGGTGGGAGNTVTQYQWDEKYNWLRN